MPRSSRWLMYRGGLCHSVRPRIAPRRRHLAEAEVRLLVKFLLQPGIGFEPLGHLGEDLLPGAHLRFGAEPDAIKWAHWLHQLADGYAKRLSQRTHGACPRLGSTPLDAPDRQPRQAGL